MKLVSEGEIKGGPDFCALVADGDDWHDGSLLRFPGDEAARHALLDLLVRPGRSNSLACRLAGEFKA